MFLQLRRKTRPPAAPQANKSWVAGLRPRISHIRQFLILVLGCRSSDAAVPEGRTLLLSIWNRKQHKMLDHFARLGFCALRLLFSWGVPNGRRRCPMLRLVSEFFLDVLCGGPHQLDLLIIFFGVSKVDVCNCSPKAAPPPTGRPTTQRFRGSIAFQGRNKSPS